MHNYNDHEANYPTDKASVKVLYNDYFHDSRITSLNIIPEKHALEMRLQCSRECEEENGGAREDIYNQKYGYVLTFFGVTYLDIQTTLDWPEYINGRFKAIAKGKYYFRIQTADGYIDVGYRSFKLRKNIGRVSYKGISGFDPWIKKAWQVSDEMLNAILTRLADDGYSEEDDFDLYLDLERLYASGRTDIAKYLRRYASSSWEVDVAVPFSAWLLGKFGSPDDIPLLRQVSDRTDDPLIKRNILDAIETLSNNELILNAE